MDAIFELGQIESVANAIWKEGKKFPVWAFYAPMGSGKTTFIHALCEILGVKSAVSSPTFALINEYQSEHSGTIQHMDWYRIKNVAEAIDAGIEEILLSGDTCLVEWPENAPSLLPDNTFHLKMEVLGEHTRRIFSFDPNAAA
jgi:tRNA threonylcarbamoyladenosine biosynthesis protein TsaE